MTPAQGAQHEGSGKRARIEEKMRKLLRKNWLHTEIWCKRAFLTSLHIEQVNVMMFLDAASFLKPSIWAENYPFPGRRVVKPPRSFSCWPPRGKIEWCAFWAE